MGGFAVAKGFPFLRAVGAEPGAEAGDAFASGRKFTETFELGQEGQGNDRERKAFRRYW